MQTYPCLCFFLQIDVLEDPVIRNVIILQTVLQEVRHRSAPVYKRLKDMIQAKEKYFYTFTNEHHRYRDAFIIKSGNRKGQNNVFFTETQTPSY